MDGGINSDQNFYSRPPFPRPPTISNDSGDQPRFNYNYDNPLQPPTLAAFDNRPPLVPPKVSLLTSSLHSVTLNGYGADSTGKSDSPVPDDFYRNFDSLQSNGYNTMNETASAAITSSTPAASPQQLFSTVRSNGSVTTPKHSTAPTGRNGLNITARSASSPIDQRMASLNTAKSTSALNNGYSRPTQPTSVNVKDLRAKFDDKKSESSARKLSFRPTTRDHGAGGAGYGRLRTASENQPPPSNTRAGSASRDLITNSGKLPSVAKTQRAKFAVEDQDSNNTLSSIARAGRNQQIISGNAQASQSMINLAPRIPPKPTAIKSPPRRPLFGEVVAADAGSSSLGYGIVNTRARRTSDSSLHQPSWPAKRVNADEEPTSPSAWYRAATPSAALLDDVERSPRSKRHNRSQSDFVGGKVSPASAMPHIRASAQSPLPASFISLATHPEVKTPPSTRSTSPYTARSTAPNGTAIRVPELGPRSPAGRATPPLHSRSPGRPNPVKINTSSSLKAYISAPLPKTSPPLRSSRPRQPVSTATTASSRLKAADKPDFRQARNSTKMSGADSRSNSRIREPSPSNRQLKAAAARATKAISRNILESEQREILRLQKVSQSTVLSVTKEIPYVRERSRPVTPALSSPKLKVNTSFLSARQHATSRQYANTSNPDSPTLGVPGSFPDQETDDEELPFSAISAATGVTEFDNEPQTEAPQASSHPQPPPESLSEYQEHGDTSDSGFHLTADRGSIKIILDTTSLHDANTTTMGIDGRQQSEMGSHSNNVPEKQAFASSGPQVREDDCASLVGNGIDEAVPSPNAVPETHYFDDMSFYGAPTTGIVEPVGIEKEKLQHWETSPYQPPSLHLPYLNTGLDMDFDGTSCRPEYLETPITDIDYESSEAGGDSAATRPGNDVDRLVSNIYTTGSSRGRGSQQLSWTNFTVDTNEYSLQDELVYLPPIPSAVHLHSPTPPPKEPILHSKSDASFKVLDHGPSPSSRTFGETPIMPSPSHPSVTGYSVSSDNIGFGQLQTFAVKSVPELPNHSPPLPPEQVVFPSTTLSGIPRPEWAINRRQSIVQHSSRDSESRRASDGADSSGPSLSTQETSIQISNVEFPQAQQPGEIKITALLGEDKEAAEKQARRLQHRGRVIKEMIDTEAVYLKDMNVVEEIYKGTAEACPRLEPNDVNIIFRNTNEIVAFSTMLLDELKAAGVSVYSPRQQKRRQSRSTTTTASTTLSPAMDMRYSISTMPAEENEIEKDRKTSVGSHFSRHLQQMQTVYADFLKNSEKASARLTELQTDAAVKVWLSECNNVAKDLTAAWNLDALLIKPVQRITRYQLLLNDLLENTPEDHPDFQALKTSVGEIADVLKNIDDLKKRIDTVGKIVGVTRRRKDSDVRTGLAKAFGRRDRAASNSNRPPDDEIYTRLHQSWDHDFIQLQIILRDVENYTRKASTWVNDFLRYLSAIELVMRVKASSRPELESKWARFNMSMRDMGTVALEDHIFAIRKEVIEPLEQIIKAYGPPALAMKKRTKRRLDYEKSLTLKTLNKKIDEKLTEMVDQYTALNETLKSELPRLSILTSKLGKICLTKFVAIQADWYNIWQAKVKTVLEESEMPKDFTDIIDKFTRDFKYQLKEANNLSIINGTFIQDTSKGRSSQSTTTTREDEPRDSPRPSSVSIGSSRNAPPISMNLSRGLSVNSDQSPRLPNLPSPDFRRSSGHEFTFSPMVNDDPGLPIFSTKDFPPLVTHSRAGSASPAAMDMSASRHGFSRPPTGRSYESGNVPRKSVESNYTARSPSTSFSFPPYDGAGDSPRDGRPPPSFRPHSGLFHSAMPPADAADDSQRSSRASSVDRERSGGYNVLYIAASLFEFNISATKTEAGYPYLTYGAGEVFDVIGEKGELWLAKNQDDAGDLVGWIWSKHFARLADN